MTIYDILSLSVRDWAAAVKAAENSKCRSCAQRLNDYRMAIDFLFGLKRITRAALTARLGCTTHIAEALIGQMIADGLALPARTDDSAVFYIPAAGAHNPFNKKKKEQ